LHHLYNPIGSWRPPSDNAYFQEKFGIKTCVTLFNPVIQRNGNSSWEPTHAQIKDIFDFRDRVNYPNDPRAGLWMLRNSIVERSYV